MKFPTPISVKDLAKKYQATIIGNENNVATGINEIHKVEAGDITFSDVQKYFNKSIHSAASIIILNQKAECPPGKTLLICEAPFEVYNDLIKQYRPIRPINCQVHDSAIIHPSATIEPNVIIGPDVKIGAHSYIQANVYIAEFTHIGQHVKIQAGTVIGTDAFYYKKNGDTYKKWRSGGRVIIEDDVDIGAQCTINKGVSGDTVIGKGTKLDCQVHIGHGVVVGQHCLIAGQVGIGGKTIIEDHVSIYGQAGIAQSIRIGAKAVIAAKSGVSKSLKGGQVYFGSPAEPLRDHHRRLAKFRRMTDK